MEKHANKVNSLTFEQAMNELETIIKRLEDGQLTLENAITLFERGSELKKHCDGKLKEAKMRVERITHTNPDGGFELEAYSA